MGPDGEKSFSDAPPPPIVKVGCRGRGGEGGINMWVAEHEWEPIMIFLLEIILRGGGESVLSNQIKLFNFRLRFIYAASVQYISVYTRLC